MSNLLYYGDNLSILRDEISDESAGLIYLDPPFNSSANYNILFKEQTGRQSASQIEAFEDTWHWTDEAETAFDEIMQSGNSGVSEMVRAMRGFLGENDMMAYLTMMAVRLLELKRVLKPTGSIYLHCDPTASHYLKILLDAVFGGKNFRNEIVWHYSKWSNVANYFQRNHDVILFYAKDTNFFSKQMVLSADKMKKLDKGYQVNRPSGVKQLIVYDKKKAQHKIEQRNYDKIIYRKPEGTPLSDTWTDINIINSQAKERLGYPTQKPLALLERIIKASSNEDDLVLDPFCGCGTAVHAAEKLGRKWIGIDITHLAISLIERRLKDAFPKVQYEVRGTPKDLEGARALAERDKYQFEWWALSLIEAVPYQGKKKGADSGIDGIIYFREDKHTTQRIIVSVKGGANVGVAMIRDLKGTMEREGAPLGLLITLAEPTAPMKKEAVAAGFHTIYSEDRKYPKVQIATIEQLLAGNLPKLPKFQSPTFKKAQREKGENKQKDLL